MKELTVREFRRQCVSLLEELPDEGIVVTKRGQPVARIIPIRRRWRDQRVTLPLFKGTARPGPLCPNIETPYDFMF